MIQLDFWRCDEESETITMREEIRKVRESNDKVRKSLFAKHGELSKMMIDLGNRLEVIEKGLCQIK